MVFGGGAHDVDNLTYLPFRQVSALQNGIHSARNHRLQDVDCLCRQVYTAAMFSTLHSTRSNVERAKIVGSAAHDTTIDARFHALHRQKPQL